MCQINVILQLVGSCDLQFLRPLLVRRRTFISNMGHVQHEAGLISDQPGGKNVLLDAERLICESALGLTFTFRLSRRLTRHQFPWQPPGDENLLPEVR